MFLIDNKVRKYICDQIVSELTEISVKAGDCRFNYNCHKNATHIAETNNDEYIVCSIYIDNGYPIIHFLNIDNDGNYIDNTLGIHTLIYKHYYWKKIYRVDYFDIDNVFYNLRREIKNGLPWYYRYFTKYNC